MSNLTILGDTSGSVVLQAPAVAGSTTLTLPTTSGTLALRSGSVVQVVNGSSFNEVSTTSSSFVTTGVTATITPTSSTSRILVIGSTTAYAASLNALAFYTVYRNSTTNIAPGSTQAFSVIYLNSTNAGGFPVAFNFLDSPATTSATTYAIWAKSNGSVEIRSNWYASVGSITLLEIAA